MHKPNILLCTVDSLRKDRISWDTMPYTASLADKGVWFDDMFATAPATAASFVGLMASRYYSDVDGIGLPDREFTTIAEALKGAGYTTIGHSTNKFTSSYYNYDRGFDDFRSPTSGLKFWVRRHLDEDSPLFQFLEWGYHHWLEFTASQSDHQFTWWNEPADSVNARLLHALPTTDGVTTDGPWLLWAHHMDPHHPLEPPEQYLPDAVPSRGHAQNITRELPGRVPEDRRDELEDVRALYDAECEYWDDEFQRLHQHLPKDTLVVVVGDHGELLGEHDRYGHPHEMWRELTNVPCLIYHPTLDPATITSLQSTLDLAPTLLDLAGVSPPESMRGRPIDIDTPRPRDSVYGTIETPEHVGMVRTSEWTWLRHQSRRSSQTDHGELLYPASGEADSQTGAQNATRRPDTVARHRELFEDELGTEPVATGHQMANEQVKQHMADLGYLEQQ